MTLHFLLYYFLADSFDYIGFEFTAVGAAQKEAVAFQSGDDTIAGLPLAGQIAIGRGYVVFAGIDDAFEVNHDRGMRNVSGGFTENFGFGLAPVFDVVAFGRSTEPVKFGGAPTDCLLHVRGVFA